MQNIKYIFFVVILSFTFSSCEERIYIPLNSLEDIIVIEANISNDNDSVTVKLSNTTDFYKPSQPLAIRGANILLTREKRDTIILTEKYPGYYSQFVENLKLEETYILSVFTNGITYTAKSFMPALTKIESIQLFTLPKEFRFGLENEGDTLTVLAFFQDSANYDNYYKLNAFIRDTAIRLGEEIISDDLQDGNYLTMDYTPRGGFYNIYDTVTIELQGINYESYTYFTQLRDSKRSEGGGIPYNPEPHFDNGALGYFSAYSSAKKTIILKNFLRPTDK